MFSHKLRVGGLALLVGLSVPAALAAQDTGTEDQDASIRVTLHSVGESSVEGTAVVGETPAPPEERQEMAMAPLRITFDLSGLEPGGQVDVVIHGGTCEEGTTTVATLGSLAADDEGNVYESRTIDDDQALEVLREGDLRTYHIQVQAGGQPLACGNFQPQG